MDFLRRLLSSNEFMPHGHCYFWRTEIVWLHVIADALITLAYLTIPFTLFHIVRKRSDLAFGWMVGCFAAFITACGTTHAMEIWTLWVPTYWLSGAIKAVTAGVSITTSVLLVRITPRIVALPGPEDLRRANEALRESAERLRGVFDNAGVGIRIADSGGRTVEVNRVLSEMLGYAAAELRGRESFDLAHPDDRSEQLFDELVSGVRDRFQIVTRYRHRAGHWVWARVTASPVRGPEGKTWNVIEIVEDITEHRESLEKLEQAQANDREKDVLLKEIHHRVKNNLQVVSGLLGLQSAAIVDERDRELFQESQNRIKSMALIHEKLYGSKDLSRVDFSDYVRVLAMDLIATYRANRQAVRLSTSLDQVYLNVNEAIPCGLILNELITNALKHGFPSGGAGELRVVLRSLPDRRVRLSVADNGVGFPKDIDFQKAESLGLKLINRLARQLDGSVELRQDSVTEFAVAFPA